MSHLPFAAVRRTTPVARALAKGLAVATLLLIGACSELLPPPIPAVEDRFDLVANVPIAGAQLEGLLEDGVALVAVESLRDDVWVRAVSHGDRVYVAWIALTAAAGPQVRLTLERTTPADDPPTLLQASSYASGEGDDLGVSALRWRSADEAHPTATEATVDFAATPADGRLEAWFAGYGLGDLGRSGSVEVQDALLLLDLLRYGGWDDFERYHGDVDGDGVLGSADLEALLEKVVDPELPAVLRVKPEELSFAQLAGIGADPGVVLVANGGRLAFTDVDWTAPDGVVATSFGGVAEQSVALEVTLPSANRLGWRPGFLRVLDGADGVAEVRLGHLVALVAGQSNASGRGLPRDGWPEPSARVLMFGNDYRWAQATEPLDSDYNQVDEVSADVQPNPAEYSFGTRLGELLAEATGFATYLVPSAKGGSRVTLASDSEDWLPGVPTDRATLFGSAVFRSRVSAGLETNPVGGTSEGGPVNVVLWYQGESDAANGARGGFVDGTQTVMNAFWSQLKVPIVYVQLASHEYASQNLQQAWIAERQRRLETASGHPSGALIDAPHHMVVAFDLPRSDHIHLSAYGQRLLAERLDLAVREHVLGEDVDGTGPRLAAIDWDGGTRVTLRTTQTLRDGDIDKAYVTVFDGPPNGVVNPTDLPTGSNTIAVSLVVRDPSDPTAIRITLAGPLTASSEPHVLYMAPPGIAPTTSPAPAVKRDLIRAADGIGVAGLGLPLPAFGPLPPF